MLTLRPRTVYKSPGDKHRGHHRDRAVQHKYRMLPSASSSTYLCQWGYSQTAHTLNPKLRQFTCGSGAESTKTACAFQRQSIAFQRSIQINMGSPEYFRRHTKSKDRQACQGGYVLWPRLLGRPEWPQHPRVLRRSEYVVGSWKPEQ